MVGSVYYETVHLDVYKDKSVLYEGGLISEFEEGLQSEDAKLRYEKIRDSLEGGFLPSVLETVRDKGIGDNLNSDDCELLNRLADGITGNYGRGLVAVAVMQMAIKAICPEQSVRLHKSSNQRNSFSWREGVSMRKLDADYVTPFLRESGLLKLNADGAMMTRTLAENYPYSKMYKAQLQGPREEWLELVTRLENNDISAEDGLEYLLSLLLNKSDAFHAQCEDAQEALRQANNITMQKTEKAVRAFLDMTSYPARAFEIVLHAFMQALRDLNYAYEPLEPLSQMRSANKKHGNVGDIELKDGRDILESWDAKYGKEYLRDELNELEDKLETSPKVAVAGFVTNIQPDMRDDVQEKIAEISLSFDTDVRILSLHDWIDYQSRMNPVSDKDKLAEAWVKALVESLTQKRPEIAPIDEPCDRWVVDITKTLRRNFK